MRQRSLSVVVTVLALVLAACGGGGGEEDAGDAAAVLCPAEVRGPVDITFWYTAQGSTQQTVKGLIDRFNGSQDDVRVRGVLVPSYPETFAKWRASLTSGAVPDVVQLEETTVQSMVDSRSAIPMQACVDADDYDLTDFVPGAVDYYTVDDQLRAMPWNVSNPVLFYDKAAFRAAGLDPEKPPRTFEEVRSSSQQLVASGVVQRGIALKVLPYYVEFWFAKAGQTLVDHANGREARSTGATLDNETGRAVWEWWDSMVDDGLALNVGTGPQPDHLLAIGNKRAAMTIDASSAIGPILDVLSTGQFAGLELAVGPLPGLGAGGGVPVGDGALWISARSAAPRRAAAWRFVKWLVEPAQQASLHVETGYVPIRRSAAEDTEVQELWRATPAYRVAYDQLLAGPRGPAAAGSIIGDYQGVRDAIVVSIVRMLSSHVPPADAVREAQAQADAAIRNYNERVG